MATREELELMLRDSITPGLRAIARELRALNQVAKETGGEGGEGASGIKEFGKSFAGIEGSAGSALKSVTAMGSYIIGFGKSIIGVGGTVESIKKLYEGIDEFATKRQSLTMFSRDTKFAVEDIARMRGAMTRMGVETKQADQYIGNISNKLQELRAFREGSTLFQDLAKIGASGLGRNLLVDVKSGDQKKALDDLLNFYKTQGPEIQYYLSQALGIPQSVLGQWQKYQAMVKETFDGDEAAAQHFIEQKAEFNEKWESEWNRFADHAITKINEVNAKLEEKTEGKHWLSDFFISGWDQVTKEIAQDVADVEHFMDLIGKGKSWWDKQVASPEKVKDVLAESVGKVWNAPGQIGSPESAAAMQDAVAKATERPKAGQPSFGDRAAAINELNLQKDDNKLLTEIRDSLQMLVGGGPEGGPGGGGGGGGGGGPGGGGGGGGQGGPNPGGPAEVTPPYSGGPVSNDLDKQKYETMFAGTPLSGKYEKVVEEAKKNGVPPSLMAAIMAHESAQGKSRFVRELNNPAGLMDKNNPNTGMRFPDIDTGIEHAAYNIGKNYRKGGGTIGGMAPIYAPPGAANDPRGLNRGWPAGVAGYQRRLASPIVVPEVKKEVPSRPEPASRPLIDHARKRMDESYSNRAFRGSANVTVDFGEQTAAARGAAAQSRAPFKDIKVTREPQAPKAGEPAEKFSRWYFQ